MQQGKVQAVLNRLMLYISFYITPFREQGLTAYRYGMLCHYYTVNYRICQIKFKHSFGGAFCCVLFVAVS